MSVSIGPGMISTTRMPNGATSARNDSPIAVTAALLARYAPRNGTGASIDEHVTLQITPPPPARMIGTARLVTSTRPNTFVSKSLRHTSAGMTSSGRLSSLDAGVVHEHAQVVGQRDRVGIGHVEPLDAHARSRSSAGTDVAHRRDDVEAAPGELDRDRAPDAHDSRR